MEAGVDRACLSAVTFEHFVAVSQLLLLHNFP